MNDELRDKFNELKQKESFKKVEEGLKKLIKIGQTDVKEIFKSDAFQEMFDQVSLLLGKEVKPTLLMIGKTGVGKSSVLNALFANGSVGETKFEIGVTPTTRDFDRRLLRSDKCDIIAVDAPGFADPTSEANIDGMTYEDKLIEYAKTNEAHMALLVLKCDDRALEPECNFLKKWFAEEKLKDFPIIVVINQVDKMQPVESWKPESLNLDNPIKKKEKNIRAYIDYVFSLKEFQPLCENGRMVPLAAPAQETDDEDDYEPRAPYNVKVLKNKIYELLPVAAKTLYARAAKMLDEEGSRIVNYYSMGAGTAVVLNPLPGSDFLSISAIQVAMTIHLGRLYHVELTQQAALALLTPVLTSFGGRFAAQSIISLIPGIKNWVGAPLAFGITMTVGKAVNAVLASGKRELTVEDVKREAAKYSESDFKKMYDEQSK